MLLATSGDNTASIWNVPYGTTWPSTPHVIIKVHTGDVSCGVFLGDESHVITGWPLRIWRISDGVQTANSESGYVRATHLSTLSHSLTLLLHRRGQCPIMLRLVSLQ